MGLLKIEEIQHIRDGKVIWSNTDLHNILHIQGEEFILNVVFSDNISKPDYYYFGLDNRTSLTLNDTLVDLIDEPIINGYFRQAVNSVDDFTFEVVEGFTRARSPILTFSALGGSWGPIRNLFLTNQDQDVSPDQGYLISSIALGQEITVASGDAITIHILH
jgi:hypothetical protein